MKCKIKNLNDIDKEIEPGWLPEMAEYCGEVHNFVYGPFYVEIDGVPFLWSKKWIIEFQNTIVLE